MQYNLYTGKIGYIKSYKEIPIMLKYILGNFIGVLLVSFVSVVDSSALDTFEKNLLERGIVASQIDGPVQDIVNNTNSSMLSNWEFTLVCGGIGVIVAIMGIYVDSVVLAYMKFRKFLREKRKR